MNCTDGGAVFVSRLVISYVHCGYSMMGGIVLFTPTTDGASLQGRRLAETHAPGTASMAIPIEHAYSLTALSLAQ